MSTKLLSESSDIKTDEPPKKKQKTDNNASTVISSVCFLHHADHEQFEELFKSIDGSELVKSLNITHFINKEIAEYATGKFKKCGNDKCENKISVLHQDKTAYDYNHSNANKLGYKFCSISDKYYCFECMHDTKSCTFNCCMELKYIPNCKECDFCGSVLFGPKPDRRCNEFECTDCGVVSCYRCFVVMQCIDCKQLFCRKCFVIRTDGVYLCNGCYDESTYNKIIECNKCNLKCKLMFKSNLTLFVPGNDIGGVKMLKCGNKDCDTFVCLNCDEKESNGKQIICDESNCHRRTGIYRCNLHISDKQKCPFHCCSESDGWYVPAELLSNNI